MELAIASIIIIFLLSFIAFLWESRRKRQLKQKLKYKNKRLQQITRMSNTIFHNINAFVLLIDSDFRVLSTNYFARVNRKEGDGDMRRVGNLISCRNALDSGLCGTHERCQECIVCRELTKAFNTKNNFLDVEAPVTMVVGREDVECEVLISGSYVQLDGQERLVLTMKDITGLINIKRENEKLQNVVSYASSTAQMGFASLGLYTSEEMLTPEYALNMGEDPDESVEQIFINFSHVHPDDRESLLIFINRAKKEKTEPLVKEVRVMSDDDDDWRWVRVHLMQKTFLPESRDITIYSMTIDITAEKKKEESLVSQRTRAEVSDRSKSAFLANMSHEIRTPLNAILGFSELLAMATSEEEKEQYLSILKSNNEMLLQLINDILDQAKIDAGVIDFTYTDVDMNSVLSDLEQLFKMRLGKDSKVKIVCEPSYPTCVINTDRNRVSQVLSNFMSNAVKFTDSGSIRIGYKPCEKGLYFYVKDTGMGIRNDKLGDVFQRFARFNEDKHGNGLGLSICKTIVEKLNGEIGVESDYGKGATFWFVLPQHPAGLSTRVETGISVDQPEPEDTLFRNTPPPSDGKERTTVLITEDVEESYRLYETILKHNYHLLWARGGEEAISLCLHYNPGVVLMNVVLPGVDGYSTTEAIRQISPKVPVIALLPAGYEVDESRLNKSGFTDFIAKPVAANLLQEKIEVYSQ